MKWLFYIAIIFCFPLIFGTMVLHAQLKKIWDFPIHINCVTFLEFPGATNIGFVGLNNGDIWKSIDFGTSWQKMNTPVLASNHYTQISDFTFKDGLVGWASHNNRGGGGIGDGGCYKTTDGGITWFETHVVSPFGTYCNGTAVYFNQITQLLFLSDWAGASQVSSDNGNSWSQFLPGVLPNYHSFNGFSFNDDLHGITSSASSSPKNWYRTTNGGMTWDSILMKGEYWQTLAVKNSSKIFAIQDGGGDFAHSEDYGITWQLSNLPTYSTGCIKIGNCNILYIQGLSVNGAYNGTLASGDWGQTWMQITKDIDISGMVDTRFYVQGDNVYMGDVNGGLWEFTRTPSLQFAPDSFYVKIPEACTPSDITLRISNLYCEGIAISSLTLEDSSIIHLGNNGPIHLNGIRDVFIPIHILSRQQGTVTTNLHIAYTHGASEIDQVIPIRVETLQNTMQPYIISNSPFSFSNTKLCSSNGLPFYFTNTGCDSIKIISISLSGSSQFSYSPKLDSSLTISSGHTLNLTVNFVPTSVGPASGSLKISLLLNGKNKDTTILFDGIGLRNDKNITFFSNAYIDSLHFDTIYTCKTKELEGFVVNSTCDSAFVQAFVSPQNNFTLISPSNSVWLRSGDTLPIKILFNSNIIGPISSRVMINAKSQNGNINMLELFLDGFVSKLSIPLEIWSTQSLVDTIPFCRNTIKTINFLLNNISICDSFLVDSVWISGAKDFRLIPFQGKILPNSSLSLTLFFLPEEKGMRVANFNLQYFNGIQNKDTSIQISIFVKDGTRILQSPTIFIDYGAISTCNEHDTTFTLQNLGCDTLLISSAGGLASGFGSNTKFPIIILPGDSTTIDLFTVLDTLGGKILNSALLSFTSNSDNTISPITLTRSYIPSKNINVGYYLDPTMRSGGDQSIVNVDIKESPGKSFTGAGIKQLTFNLLNYNTDLLQYTQSKSTANLSSPDGRSFTISGSPEITADANGILASVGFRVYLTKDSVTSINMTNRTDTTNLPCSIMTLTSSGTAIFNYQFLCGEKSIAGFMNGIPISITSIRPNPAQDEIEINLQSALKQDANIEIRNALGAYVYSGAKNLVSGSNSIHLDTKFLSSGIYLLKAASDIGSTSQEFIKIK